MPRPSMPKISSIQAHSLLNVIHSDAFGFLLTPSKGAAMYFATFIGKCSHWTVVYPIKMESDVFQTFQIYQVLAERQTGRKIQTFFSNGKGKYVSAEFEPYLTARGIKRLRSCAYLPHQMPLVNR